MTRRKARDRSFTVMVIPHSESAPLIFRLSLRFIQVFCTVFVILVVAGIVFVANYNAVVAKADEVDDLRAINVEQKEQISELVAQIEALQVRVAELDALDQELRKMLNMDLGYGQTAGAVIAAASKSAVEAPGVGGRQVAQAVSPAGMEGNVAAAVDIPSQLLEQDPSLRDTVVLKAAIANIQEQLSLRKDSLAAVALALEDQLAFLMSRPTGWPVKGLITSRYGWRRSPYSWAREFHDGIDIGAPRGTPIQVTADGTVVFSGWKAGYGRIVIVRHGFGFETRYAHNSRNLVSVGQRVKRGEIIAYVGSSGRSTGPHVHYEVRRYGRLLNPRDFLAPPTD